MNSKVQKTILNALLILPLIVFGACGKSGKVDTTTQELTNKNSRPEKVRVEPQEIRFINDYQLAMDTARKESKPVLMFFALPNCSTAERIKETTFQEVEIKRLANRFVCLWVDANTETQLCESHRVTGFPTMLILNSAGVELKRLSGKQMTEQLSLQMHVTIQSITAKNPLIVRK